MRIIATTPEENEILEELSKNLRSKGIYPSITKYGDGFGITVWSVDDLDALPIACDWPHEEKLRFMEMYGEKIGGATDDAWERLRSYVEIHISTRRESN